LKFLLDANVLLWSFTDRKKLTPRVRQIIDDESNDFFVSRTCIWELSAKAAVGRLPGLGPTIQRLIDQMNIVGINVLQLEDRYILRSEKLPWHHSDPFDRILVAQALEEGLTILTSDSDIPRYDAPTIWK
jgi:PIN domain nuclease of toxin-antitoxin system